MKRRKLLNLLGLLPLLVIVGCADAKAPQLIEVESLAQLGAEAKASNLPIMLFVTAPHCGYCHQLERDVIVPMLKNPRYPQYVLLRRLNLGKETLTDFDGTAKDSMTIAARYKAQLTPTLVFVSPDGQKLTDNIVGVAADLDLYGGMIDARIDQALSKLGNSLKINPNQ